MHFESGVVLDFGSKDQQHIWPINETNCAWPMA